MSKLLTLNNLAGHNIQTGDGIELLSSVIATGAGTPVQMPSGGRVWTV